MSNRLFLGIAAVLACGVVQVAAECWYVAIEWPTYPDGDGKAPFEVYGDNSTDNLHIPNRALKGSPDGFSYQAAVEEEYIDQPQLDVVFDTTDKEIKLLYVEYKVMRAEGMRLKVRKEDYFTTYNEYFPNLSNDNLLEEWSPQSVALFTLMPRVANISLIFDHCTSNPLLCQNNVWVKDLKIYVSVCTQEYPECECETRGDPVAKQYDNTVFPLYPVQPGDVCLMSKTDFPAGPADDFCGWRVDALIIDDSAGHTIIKEVHVDLRYQGHQKSFKMNPAGIYDLTTGVDLTETSGTWWGTTRDDAGLNLFTLEVASSCSFRLSGTQLDQERKTTYMIHTKWSDMLTSATGLCGNCDNQMNDFHDAQGNIINGIGRFQTMTGIYCSSAA